MPNNPALVGWTTWWQSIDAAQMRLTNRIPITVMVTELDRSPGRLPLSGVDPCRSTSSSSTAETGATVADYWAATDRGYTDAIRRRPDEPTRRLNEVAHTVYRRVYDTSRIEWVPSSVTDFLNGRKNGTTYPHVNELPSLNGLYLTSFLRRRNFSTAMIRNFYSDQAQLEAILREKEAQARRDLVDVHLHRPGRARGHRGVLPEAPPRGQMVYGGASLYSLRNVMSPADATASS